MPILSSLGGMAPIGRHARSSALFVAAISSNQTDLNLATWALANGWDGSSEARITINSGVYIYSTNTANAGLTTGAFPYLKIINNGYIMGKGGNSGSNPGGDAISLGCDCEIDSTSGYIGGGGGGGGSARMGGGGAGGGTGSNGSAAGGAPGSNGGTGVQYPTNGGGGGGRVFPGANVTTSNFYPNTQNYYGKGGSGGGSPGGEMGSGGLNAGGIGGGPGIAGTNNNMSGSWYSGGGGGGWGADGGPYRDYGGGYVAGGAAGKAVALNGHTLTWTGGSKPATVYGADA